MFFSFFLTDKGGKRSCSDISQPNSSLRMSSTSWWRDTSELGGLHGVEFGVLKWEIKDGGSLENKQAGWLGSGQTTRPVTNSTG